MDQYSIAFSVSNLGPKKFQHLKNNFPNLEEAWNADRSEFEKLEIKGETLKKFDKFREEFNIDNYQLKLEKAGVQFISQESKFYPKSLLKIENPPIGLFVKGNLKLLRHQFCIAVVGTRKITNYGKNITESIVSDLSNNGVCIISGLALGVDGTAHRSALENKSPTIAVLGCGVDCCRPSENYSLYRQILDKGGLIISEYPLSLPPNKGTFLARNRIIAAISIGVLVTEAAEGSGSLVTAEYGFQFNKKVFAVPGQVGSQMSGGTLQLLKKGAKLVTDANDVLEEFKIQKLINNRESQKFKSFNSDEKKIVSLLQSEELTIDEISKKLIIPVSNLFVSISNLELKGIINNNSGKLKIV